MPQTIQVIATWDPEARVWVAESEHVPGLITGADTISALLEKLRVLIPELLALNGGADRGTEVPIELLARYQA